MAEAVTVPVHPKSLHHDALFPTHDAPKAGHQEFEEHLQDYDRMYTGLAYGSQCGTILQTVHQVSAK